jgi:hypothetical protein
LEAAHDGITNRMARVADRGGRTPAHKGDGRGWSTTSTREFQVTRDAILQTGERRYVEQAEVGKDLGKCPVGGASPSTGSLGELFLADRAALKSMKSDEQLA